MQSTPVASANESSALAATTRPDLLATLSVAKQLLAETRDLNVILNIHDTAVAAQAWARARNADEVAMQAVEVKLRAERRAGEFLQDMKKKGILSVGRPKENSNNLLPLSPTLKSIGVEKIESQRWQRFAGIPEAQFEDWIIYAKKKTQAALLALTVFRTHENKPFPTGTFDIILSDPPWQYDFNLSDRGDPEVHYDTMTVEEIANLPIPSSENAVLFLWATNPKLTDAMYVMEKWGFVYRTNMVWIKDRFGTGYYARGQHELLLIGVKGDIHPPEESNRPSSIINAPVREHSRKPDVVYETIEKMYPNSQRLELFSRNSREGWTSWGS